MTARAYRVTIEGTELITFASSIKSARTNAKRAVRRCTDAIPIAKRERKYEALSKLGEVHSTHATCFVPAELDRLLDLLPEIER